MPYILIIISLSYHATFMQEFSSRDTCLAAAEAVKAVHSSVGRKVMTECVLK